MGDWCHLNHGGHVPPPATSQQPGEGVLAWPILLTGGWGQSPRSRTHPPGSGHGAPGSDRSTTPSALTLWPALMGGAPVPTLPIA